MRKLPSNLVQRRAGRLKRTLVLSAALLLCGCAKFPNSGGGTGSTRIVVSMYVAGKIRTGSEQTSGGLPYIYMVAINPTTEENPITQGPIPVIGPPWGNGFVAGQCRFFMWWNPLQFPKYGLYQFQDTLLNQYSLIGTPVISENITEGVNRIKFEFDLSQLITDPNELLTIKALQINFLTMDRIPQVGVEKFWDANGDARSGLSQDINQPILISLRTSAVYDNSRAFIKEPANDVVGANDPDLDIIDWSIEVRLPQQQ